MKNYGVNATIHNRCVLEHIDAYTILGGVNIINSGRMRWADHEAQMEEARNTHKILVGIS